MDARAEALLREIAANPADNEPRLAFAKHIEVHAPAHAALIVAQCTGAMTPELLQAFEAELPAQLRDILDNAWGEPDDDLDDDAHPLQPVRGFFELASWRCELRDFVAIDPDVLLRLAPACKTLCLQAITDFAVVGARIRHFDVLAIESTYVNSDAAKLLAATPGLSHLRELRFDASGVDVPSLAALYDTLPALERLSLTVRRADGDDSLLTAVGRTACARSVRQLMVYGRGQPVLDLRDFTVLRDVNANACVVDDRFVETPSRFHALSFGSCDFSTSFRAALNHARVFGKLRELHLLCNTSQREALLGMLGSRGLGRLRVLTADDNEREDEHVVQALGNVTSSLEELRLGFAIGDTGLRSLAAVPFATLTWLELTSPITPGAARAFANAPWIGGLRELTFDVSLLDEEGARMLAAALSTDCRKTLCGESYQEIFDAFGVTSEDIDDNPPPDEI